MTYRQTDRHVYPCLCLYPCPRTEPAPFSINLQFISFQMHLEGEKWNCPSGSSSHAELPWELVPAQPFRKIFHPPLALLGGKLPSLCQTGNRREKMKRGERERERAFQACNSVIAQWIDLLRLRGLFVFAGTEEEDQQWCNGPQADRPSTELRGESATQGLLKFLFQIQLCACCILHSG